MFNCQSAGWCKETKKNRIHDISPGTLTGLVRAGDPGGDSIVYDSTLTDQVLRKRNIYRRPDKSSNITNQCKSRLPKDVSIVSKSLNMNVSTSLL